MFNTIEADFFMEVREADPEDCKTIIRALYALEGRRDEDGEYTPLGYLVGSLANELMGNGILKLKYPEAEI